MSEILGGMGTILIAVAVFYLIHTSKEVFILWMNRKKLDDKQLIEKRIAALESQVNALQLGKNYERF